MASEKKARKMGAAEKQVHKPKTRSCPADGKAMVWAKVGSRMRFWCPECAGVA